MFNISVLISGGGTTLLNLIEVKKLGGLDANIVQVISSNTKAAGNRFATENSIPLEIVKRQEYQTDQEFSEAIFQHCRNAGTDLVVMGGFLKKIVVPADFTNQVINIHPSLIPAFCGQGFYGMKVHEAVINYGCKVSGCTVHFVDNEYDHGPVIAQQPIEVGPGSTASSLQESVFAAECRLYPWVINKIANGKLTILDRLVTLGN